MIFLSEHFFSDEFRCKCGLDTCNAPTYPHPELIKRLERLREQVGHPIVVNSGMRCKPYNAKVGGKGDSAHLDGTAVDISCPSSAHRYSYLKYALPLFRRIGIGKDFMHLDVSLTHDQDVIWMY